MPELPEVETLRRDLEASIVGRRIEAVAVTGARTVRRYGLASGSGPGAVLASGLEGRVVVGVGRRGKYLLCHLGGGDVWVVHLGMSGQLLLARSTLDVEAPHTHVRVSFFDGAELRFVDPRTFGECWVTRVGGDGGGGGDGVPELAHLGFEPLDEALNPSRLADALARTRRALKPLLCEQRFIAGIGNIYSDEILHAARLRWDRPGSSLVHAEVCRLHASIVEILTAAIDARGSSLADSQYRDLEGQVGGYQLAHRVYAREGRPCLVCGTPIVRIRVAGRSSFFCPRCQA
ncbi:MAG: bifunctional DNA-formamidopyrimidine glycosylase/DNA-(apurinic or apyrimidinic site) lyase [Acidimicrobiales bacterium]